MAATRTTARTARRDLEQAAMAPIFARAFRGVQYIEDAEGRRVRVWEDVDCCNAEHVVEWLRGKRVVEDLNEGLEYVKQATLDRLVRDRHLVRIAGGMYAITEKCAKHYDLHRYVSKRVKFHQA